MHQEKVLLRECAANGTYIVVDSSGCQPLDCYSVSFLDEILSTISAATESTVCGSYSCNLNSAGSAAILGPSDESSCATTEPAVIAVNFNFTFPSIEYMDLQLANFHSAAVEAYGITSDDVFLVEKSYITYHRYQATLTEYSSFLGFALQSAVSATLGVDYYSCSVMFEGMF